MKVLKVVKNIGLPAAVGEMKRMAAGALCVCLLSVALPACGGSGEPEIEPDPGPGPEPVSPYFISFKYNGTAYEIRNDTYCFFTRHADTYYVVEGVDIEKEQALSISIAEKLERNGSYDIYATIHYEPSSIYILFSSGDGIAESGFATDNMAEWGKIGTLTVTELTDGRMSGAFTCRMKNGEITDGKFTVKAKEYE
jgi:hypothetical protein